MVPRRVVFCVTNDLVHDQRVHKMATTLQADGWAPLLIGRRRRQSSPLPHRPYDTLRMRLPFERGKLFYLSYNLWLLLRLLRTRMDVLCANDLDTLPACYVVAMLKRVPLVYDSHEYFSGAVELVDRPATRSMWQLAEKVLLPLLPLRLTVTHSVAQAYKADIPGSQWQVLHNLPHRVPAAAAPLEKAQPPVLLYQGMLNEGRGLHWLIAALPLLPGWQVWLVGGGVMEAPLRAQAAALGMQDRVRFWGMQPFETLHTITPQATIGVSIEDDLSPNNRYAAPNKLFDYIQHGVPAVVTPLPEHSQLVRQWRVGQVMEAFSAATLAQAVRALAQPEAYAQAVQQCHAAAATLCWETQQAHIRAIYTQAQMSAYVV
jgi:glycosyltransferase involved in cell wall biosynthesis